MSSTPSSGTPPKSTAFWDSTFALILLIAAILFARFFIAEPFKIPSGSMEPTLFGHEDYGDRILTNKLAYAPAGYSLLIGAGALAIIAVGFFASRAYTRLRSFVIGGVLFVGTAAGFGLAYTRTAIAGEPQRFDVVVFQYESDWGPYPPAKSEKINYIKRLCGLPGDTIKIAAGDLYLLDRKASDAEGEDIYHIIRKWEVDPGLQDIQWYPVSLAWTGDVYKDAPADEREKIAVPWTGAETGAAGVTRKPKSLDLDGNSSVKLSYMYPVTNIYLKQGRWPFKHEGCPATKPDPLKGPSGALFRNPDEKSENITSYIFHTWEGVQCPNCKQVEFPITPNPLSGPRITPSDTARFFYGGENIVGDLKLEMDIQIEQSGKIELRVGSNLHQAVWVLNGAAPQESGTEHPVTKTSALSPGHHTLSLAYVDATVIASLDGTEIERRPIDVKMPSKEPESSVATISFEKVKGSITRLDLFRDLYYTERINSPMSGHDTKDGSGKALRGYDAAGRYFASVPDGHYLMLGDNSPSSSDGRVWGFVPRENLVGRASVIGWPPSRARFIR